jgi:hypothetical protein
MSDEFKGLELLRSLGDFDDPTGLAARVQVETMVEEMRREALLNPGATYRTNEDGPERTIKEILEGCDAEDRMIAALKEALKRGET